MVPRLKKKLKKKREKYYPGEEKCEGNSRQIYHHIQKHANTEQDEGFIGNCKPFSITRVKSAEQGAAVVEAEKTEGGCLAEGWNTLLALPQWRWW